eukprot:TRINITY_DN113362_c0_g1_i1.p1 TRINITY_DN113362_c0_g1~~TRINITY_DN113362_c0_g1_i1.p1  ORF type:complete len:824 (-),score=77.09 TRINITY_DN113362_c0_g1_i1:87-2345(-)
MRANIKPEQKQQLKLDHPPQLVYLKSEFYASLREPLRQRTKVRTDPRLKQRTIKAADNGQRTGKAQFTPSPFMAGAGVSNKGLSRTLHQLLADSEKRITHCKFGGKHTDDSFGKTHSVTIPPKRTPRKNKERSTTEEMTAHEESVDVVELSDLFTPTKEQTEDSKSNQNTVETDNTTVSDTEGSSSAVQFHIPTAPPSPPPKRPSAFITQPHSPTQSSSYSPHASLQAPTLSTLLPHIFSSSNASSSSLSASTAAALKSNALTNPAARQSLQSFSQATPHAGPLQYRKCDTTVAQPPPAVLLPPAPPNGSRPSSARSPRVEYETKHHSRPSPIGPLLTPERELKVLTDEMAADGDGIIQQFRRFQHWEEASHSSFNGSTAQELERCNGERRQCFDKKFEVLYKLLANDMVFHTSWTGALKDMNAQVSMDLESDYREWYKKQALANLQLCEHLLHGLPVETKDTSIVIDNLRKMVDVEDPVLDDPKFEELMHCVPPHRYLMNEVVSVFDIVRHLFGVSDERFHSLVNERLKKFEAKKLPIQFTVKQAAPHKEVKTAKLHVKIINASNLEAKGAAANRLHPYVVVKCSTDKRERKTAVKPNTNRPHWNEKFMFNLPLLSTSAMLDLTVYDSRNQTDVNQHEALGFGRVVLDTLPTGERKRWKLQLKGVRHGQLSVELLHEVISTVTTPRGSHVHTRSSRASTFTEATNTTSTTPSIPPMSPSGSVHGVTLNLNIPSRQPSVVSRYSASDPFPDL